LLAAICSILLAASAPSSAQQPLTGHWEGFLQRQGSTAAVSLDLTVGGGVAKGTMTMPSVGMFREPLSNITYRSSLMHFEQQNLDAVFDGDIQGDRITGRMRFIWLTGTFSLHRANERPLPYTQQDVTFRDGGVTLAGTVITPLSPGPHSAIVFTHGGGPDTRDLSRFYADLFARRGVASLIYDKRGVGGSSPELDWGASSFDDLAGDALAGVHFMQRQKGIDPKRVGLYGPSNGAWVVEKAAARSNDVAFLIVVSGGGIPNWESEVFRVGAQSRASGLPQASVNRAVAFMQQKFQVARTGQGWNAFQTHIVTSRHDSWFGYVNPPTSLAALREAWIGQFSYDPYADLESIRVPVLAIFGGMDTETPATEISAITASALKKGGDDRYTVRSFPNANHGIMDFPQSGRPWYFFKYADGYLDTLTSWVLKQ
jgi:pimeloyl-ACP methyl ester carboxylesterase